MVATLPETESQVDFSQSLPILLRGATKAIHDETTNMEPVGWLTRGELSKEEYVRYLMMLYHIYL